MDRDEVWKTTDSERLGMADFLEGLSPEEWERPSMCPGWRVRDVAAHLTLAPETDLSTVLVELVRARGSFNRMVRDMARRKAAQPVRKLVADLRQISGSRRLAPGQSYLEPMLDILVHGQDIALALGRPREMPVPAACAAADRVWSLGFPFWARRRLRGFRLAAIDVCWERGAGAPIEGPIDAILLLLTGRPASLPRLTGVGVAELTRRMTS
jgi:uncharacterized protein (TIGR03083 family)